ncbi:MAG TPA: hypothetical protein VGR45_02185 [Stellaceae bacterium]|nr:hypothetical protein [Stellaceae bacterium]
MADRHPVVLFTVIDFADEAVIGIAAVPITAGSEAQPALALLRQALLAPGPKTRAAHMPRRAVLMLAGPRRRD